jgi:hypothetical protein
MDRINVIEAARCQLIRRRELIEQFDPHGFFTFEHWRGGVCIDKRTSPNVVTIEGKNWMLDTTFNNGTNITVWYMGLIDLVGYSALAEADTYDNIDQAGNGWDEYKNYNYAASSVNRGTWNVGAASGKQVTSSTQTQFDITGAGGTIKGAFICGGTNAQTKGDHSAGAAHKLFSATLLTGGDVVVAASDTFKVTYTVAT